MIITRTFRNLYSYLYVRDDLIVCWYVISGSKTATTVVIPEKNSVAMIIFCELRSSTELPRDTSVSTGKHLCFTYPL